MTKLPLPPWRFFFSFFPPFVYRSLKKAEINLNIIKDGYNHTKGMYDKIKAQVDSQPKDDGSLFEKRRELQKEVDNAKRAYTQQV